MSKSWTVMSMKMPPDRGMNASGGSLESRLTMRSVCGRPIRPAATSRWSAANAGSNRRWNATMSVTCRRSTSA